MEVFGEYLDLDGPAPGLLGQDPITVARGRTKKSYSGESCTLSFSRENKRPSNEPREQEERKELMVGNMKQKRKRKYNFLAPFSTG